MQKIGITWKIYFYIDTENIYRDTDIKNMKSDKIIALDKKKIVNIVIWVRIYLYLFILSKVNPQATTQWPSQQK